MIILPYKGAIPKISNDCFVAENATIVGDVIIDSESSIWFGASIRAERGSVRIGKRVNIQDNCVIHTDDDECVIGDGVSVGHSAVVHGATIGSNTLVGMGSILMNGSRIGRNSIIGAAALVTQDAVFPDGSLILGSPAALKRKLTSEEISKISENAAHYNEFRCDYIQMTKTTR